MSQENLFGYVSDQDQSLVSKSGGFLKFGLNTNAKVTKFIFNTMAGKGGTPGEAIDLDVEIDGQRQSLRLFLPNRVYVGGTEITDTNSEAYKKAFANNMMQLRGTVTHIVKALGVTDETIKSALIAANPQSFAQWANIMTSLVGTNYQEKPIDIFLEYQWNIAQGNNKTYLEIPRNMKGGYFIVPAVAGDWKEEREWLENGIKVSGLRYINEAGAIHPIQKSAPYMASNKAIQQVEENPFAANGATTIATPQASTW